MPKTKTDPFFAAIIKLFYDNVKEVLINEDENKKKHFIAIKIFRPFKEDKHRIDMSGFRIVIECSLVNATLRVYEIAAINAAIFESINDPMEMIFLIDSPEYKTIQKLLSDMETAKDKEKDEYHETIRNEFLSGKLTFKNHIETYVEEVNSKKNRENTNYQKEPDIMIFGDEDYNEDVGG